MLLFAKCRQNRQGCHWIQTWGTITRQTSISFIYNSPAEWSDKVRVLYVTWLNQVKVLQMFQEIDMILKRKYPSLVSHVFIHFRYYIKKGNKGKSNQTTKWTIISVYHQITVFPENSLTFWLIFSPELNKANNRRDPVWSVFDLF